MFEVDSHSKEFDRDFKRLFRHDRTLAHELIELIATELMPNGCVPGSYHPHVLDTPGGLYNGCVPDSYHPHVLDNPGGLYNGCVEFHLADDVLVLYYPPKPHDIIHLRVIRTHDELTTGHYSKEWPNT